MTRNLEMPVEGDILNLIFRNFNISCRYAGKEEIVQPKPASRKRQYFKHFIESRNSDIPTIVVFSKSGIRRPDYLNNLETFLSNVLLPEFEVPKFLGIVDLKSGDRKDCLGVWEYVSGRQTTMEGLKADAEDLHRLVLASAAISTIAEDAARHVSQLPCGVKYFSPVSGEVRSKLNSFALGDEELGHLLAQLELFARVEDKVLRRINSMGNRTFCHLDFGPMNIFFPPKDEPLIVVDWDSSCIGPPGCTLRRLAEFSITTRKVMANLYVDFLDAKGMACEVDDILFAIHAFHVFYCLAWGIAPNRVGTKKAERAIRRGLDTVVCLDL